MTFEDRLKTETWACGQCKAYNCSAEKKQKTCDLDGLASEFVHHVMLVGGHPVMTAVSLP